MESIGDTPYPARRCALDPHPVTQSTGPRTFAVAVAVARAPGGLAGGGAAAHHGHLAGPDHLLDAVAPEQGHERLDLVLRAGHLHHQRVGRHVHHLAPEDVHDLHDLRRGWSAWPTP